MLPASGAGGVDGNRVAVMRRPGWLTSLLCCPPPGIVTGVEAQTGGGSGEVFVAWSPRPPGERVIAYRVYRRVQTGVWRLLADVTAGATDVNFPGKIVLLDFPDNFPGFSDFGATGERTYVVTALGRSGLEGLPSAAVVGTPP
jgi:hypothetical protein